MSKRSLGYIVFKRYCSIVISHAVLDKLLLCQEGARRLFRTLTGAMGIP